jgi:hypothetical protein
MGWRATVAVGLALTLMGALVPAAGARVTGLQRVTSNVLFDSSSPKTGTAACGGSRRVLGGAGEVAFPLGEVILDDVRPNAALTSVFMQALEDETGFASDWAAVAHAICADPLPGLQLVSATSAFDSSNKSVTATCPAGKQALGALGEINAGSGQVILDDVRPNPGLTSVTVQGVEDETGQAGGWSITAHAICANTVPGLQRVSVTSPLNSQSNGATATCPQFKQAVGAGFDINAGIGQVVANRVFPETATPSFGLKGVQVSAHEDETGFAGLWSVTAYAICAPSTERVSLTSPLDSESKVEFSTCAPGRALLSAGYELNAASGEAGIQYVQPDEDIINGVTSFSAFAAEDGDGKAGPWSLTLHAICANAPNAFLETVVGPTDSNTNKGADATCPAGTEAIGGGGSVGGSGEVLMDTFRPVSFLNGVTGFRVNGTEDADGFAGNWAVTAYALCAPAPPGYEHVVAPGAFNSSNKTTSVSCPAGKIVAASGGRVASGGGRVQLDDVRPNAALTTVVVQGVEAQGGIDTDWGLEAYALCINGDP